jgi:2-polyprenyl-6-hydroxyphenyl methylase/3-demethylubiquinone-9 3-methyltransferase
VLTRDTRLLAPSSAPLPATFGERRYEDVWGTQFWGFVEAAMRPGISILDVGAGRRPTIAVGERPAGVTYVGLDLSREELETSPAGSYDESIVADASRPLAELVGRFDLIVAWQVLEHFRELRPAARAFHSYTREGGWFVACLSGRHAAFAVANRLLPDRLGAHLVSRLRRRPLEEVFTAHYDLCDERGLRDAFSDWSELHLFPLWRGADYFERLPRLRVAYIRYEDWAIRRQFGNLATHYVIAARR